MDGILRGYRQSGAKLGPHCAQAVAIQAARALEYLHRQRVIYRDLKVRKQQYKTLSLICKMVLIFFRLKTS